MKLHCLSLLCLKTGGTLLVVLISNVSFRSQATAAQALPECDMVRERLKWH